MVHMMEGSSLKSPLRSFSVLVFLLLTHFDEVQCRPIAPSQRVVSMVGGDAVLPCHLEAGLDAAQVTVEWGRPDLEPRFVYIWHNGKELTNNQNAAYKGRASMSADELKQGNASLKLTQLKISDNGRYRCYIPGQNKEYFVELLVATMDKSGYSLTACIVIAVASGIAGVAIGVVGTAKYKWKMMLNVIAAVSTLFVLMFLTEGLIKLAVSLLPALYVTYKWKRDKTELEKKNSELLKDFEKKEEDLTLMLMEKAELEKKNSELRKDSENQELAMTWTEKAELEKKNFELRKDSDKKEQDLTKTLMEKAELEKKNSELLNDFEKKEQELTETLMEKAELEKKNSELLNDFEKKEQDLTKTLMEKAELEKKNSEVPKDSEKKVHDLVMTLMEVKTELENWRNKLRDVLDDIEKKKKENKQKLQLVEKEITEREANFDKPEELLREKENLLRDQWNLDQIKKDTERQLLNIEKLMDPIEMQFTRIHRVDKENVQTCLRQ